MAKEFHLIYIFLRSLFDIYHLLFALNLTSFVRPRPGAIHGEVMVMGEEGEEGRGDSV